MVAQARQAIRNVEAALSEAGASLGDVVRIRYYITDRSFVQPVRPPFAELFGQIWPAATATLCELIDARM